MRKINISLNCMSTTWGEIHVVCANVTLSLAKYVFCSGQFTLLYRVNKAFLKFLSKNCIKCQKDSIFKEILSTNLSQLYTHINFIDARRDQQ